MEPQSVTIVTRTPPERVPPVVSAALLLAEVADSVRLICPVCAPETKALLAHAGVGPITELSVGSRPSTLTGKVASWARFRHEAWRALTSAGRPDLLWIATADTALGLGPRLLHRRYLLTLLELYDRVPHYRLALRAYARAAAAVVVPEYCRAHIIRSWYGLDTTPLVLPNKPHFHPRLPRLALPSPASELMPEGARQRLVLYQGILNPDRDLACLASVVARLGTPWRLAVMGPPPEQTLAALSHVCPDVIAIPFMPAPDYLRVTSYAHIGVLSYAHRSLNQVFCAPNKTWEYTGFGIPCLCADVPGLALTLGAEGAGMCCDMGDEASVEHTLRALHDGWQAASRAATTFFDSVDCRAIVTHALSMASTHT